VLQTASQPSKKKPVEELLARAMGHHQKGELPQAEKYYKRALKSAPDNADALHLSGLVAHQLGRHPRAIKLINKAIRKDKNQTVFHTNLAVIHNHLGNWQEARDAARTAVDLNEKDGEAWGNLGQALAGLNEIAPALEAMDQSLMLSPGNVQVLCNKATLHVAQEKFCEAEEACRQALALQPNLPKALHTLGIIQSTGGKFDEAIESFGRAYQGDPLNGQTITNLASLYSAKSRYEDAIVLFDEVLRINPGSVEAHYNLGVCYSEKGEMDQAIDCFRRAIELNPAHIDSQYALATSGKVTLTPDQLTHLAELSASDQVSLEDKAKLNFALGTQADRQKLPAPAITFYTKGNSYRRALLEAKGQGFDPVAHTGLVKRISNQFTRSFFDERKSWGDASDLPVFVVGMPRSGTTLVEKILASHPDVIGAGERPDIPALIQNLERVGGSLYPEDMASFSQEEIDRITRDDLKVLSDLANGAKRVVDKMPVNFLYLGLIVLLYPNARIIHCRRDPRDTALSCYFQNFVHSHAWSCDLGHIGTYYGTYAEIMDHWREVLPLPILDVAYEDVVQDQETLSRRMIDFIGLEWDSACLDFHSSSGAVRTASKWQVRQPIYTNSVARWKDYEAFLTPFTQALY